MKYDAMNKFLCLQWLNNKVVNLTSSLQVSGLVDVKRRSGSQTLNPQCQKSLKAYQDGMDAVDRSNQYREREVQVLHAKLITRSVTKKSLSIEDHQ